MIIWMARVLFRAGIAMLILCLIVRPAIHTSSGLMGDNLGIIACLLLIGISLLYIKFSPKDEGDETTTKPRASHSPKHP